MMFLNIALLGGIAVASYRTGREKPLPGVKQKSNKESRRRKLKKAFPHDVQCPVTEPLMQSEGCMCGATARRREYAIDACLAHDDCKQSVHVARACFKATAAR